MSFQMFFFVVVNVVGVNQLHHFFPILSDVYDGSGNFHCIYHQYNHFDTMM